MVRRSSWHIDTTRNLNAVCKYQVTFTKHIPCLILLWANMVITDLCFPTKSPLRIQQQAEEILITVEKPQRISKPITYWDVKFSRHTLLTLTDPFAPGEGRYLHRANIHINAYSISSFCLCMYLYIYLSFVWGFNLTFWVWTLDQNQFIIKDHIFTNKATLKHYCLIPHSVILERICICTVHHTCHMWLFSTWSVVIVTKEHSFKFALFYRT